MNAPPFRTPLPRGSRKAVPGIDPPFASVLADFESDTTHTVSFGAAAATRCHAHPRSEHVPMPLDPVPPRQPLPAALER